MDGTFAGHRHCCCLTVLPVLGWRDPCVRRTSRALDTARRGGADVVFVHSIPKRLKKIRVGRFEIVRARPPNRS